MDIVVARALEIKPTVKGRVARRKQAPTRAIRQLSLDESETQEATKYPQQHTHRLEDSSPEDKVEIFLNLFMNGLKQHSRPQPVCVKEVAESEVKALIDPGALVNVMGIQQYRHLKPKPPLTPCNTKLTYESQSLLPLNGRMTVSIHSNGQ
ncbi:hypothetical protein NDU88_003560 [Pleurodeles waltl]|uniref:Uncharacterized protein n=1 Tax=Pleurodeles waltl TaxID=8319 RepID=A0AAV7KVA2_PLEWA|nr:hypothetical protein NDU88_003560 [Pleurodeles waltl]